MSSERGGQGGQGRGQGGGQARGLGMEKGGQGGQGGQGGAGAAGQQKLHTISNAAGDSRQVTQADWKANRAQYEADGWSRPEEAAEVDGTVEGTGGTDATDASGGTTGGTTGQL